MLVSIIAGITLLYITVVVAYVYLMSEMPDMPDWEEMDLGKAGSPTTGCVLIKTINDG